ncbi:MAG: radical SAM protein [Deferrisomatales bacterium]|nr:radical SAM protein [Deferrisomatales bacterium]
MKRFLFDIDVVGACNLRCPSCPQGNVKDYRLPHGFMEPELLARIVEKARSECEVASISLFSWGEPLLHPRLPDMIRVVNAAGIQCHLSSNLNLGQDADAIMAANPASFKISVSGFTQEVYGRTHRGGDVERVKRHMIELAAAKKRQHATTRIFVNYHRYRHNLSEGERIREFAEKLGIDFEPVWALMLPLEKILGYGGEEVAGFPLTGEDERLIDNLALPLPAALAAARGDPGEPCILREAQVSLDFQGNVQLCCGIFDDSKFTIGPYLGLSLAEIQRLREAHPLCRRCLEAGGHLYLTYRVPDLEGLVLGSLSTAEVALPGLRREIARKRMERRLTRLYNRFFSGVFSAGRVEK